MDLWWDDQRKSAQSTEATLAAFGEDVAANGGRLVIVYVPNPYQLTPAECSVGRFLDRVDRDVVLPRDSGTQAWLRAFSARHRIEFLDPSDAMRDAAVARASGGQPPLYLRADCHWSADGHQFMAGWLADWYFLGQHRQ
jgi:lysophospholipase L1-like esterase